MTMSFNMHCLYRLADGIAVLVAGLLLAVPSLALAAYALSLIR